MASTVTVKRTELDLQEAVNHLASRLEGIVRENSDLKRQVASTPINLNGDRSDLSSTAPMRVRSFTLLPTTPVFSGKLEDNRTGCKCLSENEQLAFVKLRLAGEALDFVALVNVAKQNLRLGNKLYSLGQCTDGATSRVKDCRMGSLVNGEEHPVAYASRQLNKAETNYSITERELLAVVWMTDHAALKWMMGLKDPRSRLMSWSLQLSEHVYKIQHRPGRKHGNAGCMSRQVCLIEASAEENMSAEQQNEEECQLFRQQSKFVEQDGLLFRETRLGLRLVVPRSQQVEILKECHDFVYAGHQGKKKTTNCKVAERFWWKNRKQSVDHHLPESERHFQRLGLDIVGPMPKTASGNRYILTIIDHFSRYLVMKPLPDETAETVARTFVFDWIFKFGVPDSIITYQGTNYVSELMTQLCQLLRVKKLRTTPGHPQRNGRTERVHRMIANMISHYVSSRHDDWDVYLLYVCAYFTFVQHTIANTQLSRYEVVHGMKMSTPYEHLIVPPAVGNDHAGELARKLRDVWKSVKQRNHSAFLQQAAQYNRKAVNRQYKVGDLVYRSNPVLKKTQVKKFQQDWKGPYPVIEVCLSVTLKLQLSFCSVSVHVNRVKPYTGPATLPASATDDQDRSRGRPCKLPPASPPVKKKPGPSATTTPDPASARTHRKIAKFSPPNSPSTPVRPPIPYNLHRHQ
ncbi:hypothetical protein PR048_024729 [Dryococelus australis]|uniref:RNA-directed DNA polymerase n=1 Tax=Dryococelus australis TaxID=614101 RepID=A0ABQ9GPH3_9NEOP|nr:hypothetical protein PR048_024729 [Dryococelus australis]